MMEASQPLSWSDLPPELIGLVLKCLPTLVDRIRLRAVCRPWRYNARLQPLPPPLPLLTLPDGTFMSIPGGEVHQIPVPLPPGTCCYGSIDSWLFLMRGDDECSLMNPFSKDTLNLPNLAVVWLRDWFSLISGCDPRFYKLVSPSPLDSSLNPLVAGLILDDEGYGSICICQPPLATDWSSRRLEEPFDLVEDLEFFNGKLYASAYGDKLLIIDIDDSLGSKPKISSIRCLIDPGSHFNSLPQHLPREETYLTSTYLVKCSTRLLMVKRLISTMPRLTSDGLLEHKHTVGFLVFEADLSTDPGQWKKVHNFGGQALFVGRHCSKSLPAGDFNGIQENCIYFMCDHLVSAVNPLHDSGVYSMANGTIVPLLSKTVVAAPCLGDLWCLTWIFSSDSV